MYEKRVESVKRTDLIAPKRFRRKMKRTLDAVSVTCVTVYLPPTGIMRCLPKRRVLTDSIKFITFTEFQPFQTSSGAIHKRVKISYDVQLDFDLFRS